jgi:hypothetical protein
MRVNPPLMAILGTAAGAVAAVVLYQTGASVTATSAVQGPHLTPSATGTWLPCDVGSKLRHGTCVTVRHRIVTVSVPAALDGASDSPGHATAVADRHAGATHPSAAAARHDRAGDGGAAKGRATEPAQEPATGRVGSGYASGGADGASDQASEDTGHETEGDGHGGGHDD